MFICLVFLLVLGIIFYQPNIKEQKVDENQVGLDTKEPINMCYLYEKATKNNLYDKAWLKLNIIDDQVIGEFYNIPAEKDSKTGNFEGRVGPLGQTILGRKAMVWWNSLAEGMQVTEELQIIFRDGSASVAFGEMVDRGDGIYVYKDKSQLSYNSEFFQISCESLGEKIFVEKYFKDNIKNIATDKPVLGGSWYVVSIKVDPLAHSGEIFYEDGHIQKKASFIYEYNKEMKKIIIEKFEII